MTSTLSAADSVRLDSSTGLWQVSGYHAIRAVLADPETFRPDNALTAITRLGGASLRVLARAGFALPPMLANNGDSSHAPLRRLTGRFFTAQAVERSVPRIRALAESGAREVTQALGRQESVDLVGLVTAELPCRVLLPMLGIEVPDADVQKLVKWSASSLELFWGRPAEHRQLELAAGAGAFYRWITERLQDVSAGESLFGAVQRFRDEAGAPLSPRQAASLCYFLLVAGHQTTSQLLAIALRRAIGDADLWTRLAVPGDGPAVAQACVEEVLRSEPPVTTWRRVLSRDAVVGTVALPAGAQLLLMLAPPDSARRYSTTACPMTTAQQDKKPHLAFGYGRHFCLGAALARAEAATVLTTLARELPGLRLCDDPDAPQLRLLSFAAPTRMLVQAG